MVINDEKDINCCYKILSDLYFSDEDNKMSLFSVLLPIWFGSNSETWGDKGVFTGSMENYKM